MPHPTFFLFTSLIYAAASVIAFIIYAVDKTAARRGWRRVPETTLHLCGVLCGWPGAWLAQKLLRHKTRKTSFQVMFWATVVVNGVLLASVLVTAVAIAR
jgi:uncharacterized membrane protein YsdA (DUF1294 family)